MSRIIALALLFSLTLGGLAQAQSVAAGTGPTTAQYLRARLEHLPQNQPFQIEGVPIHATQVLPVFYERRLYQPIWSSGLGLSAAGSELVTAIREVGSEGLTPNHYHLAEIEPLIGRIRSAPTAALVAELDILLTDAFLILGAHLVSGRVDPETFDAEWIASRREVDLVQALETALESGRPATVLAELLPDHPGYGRLRSALQRYREIAASGGWTTVSPGPLLHPDDSDLRVVELRARLGAADAGLAATGASQVYDDDLAATVRHFQRRHGLAPDGVVGEKTLAALNVSAEDRVRQIELNLERWRWLPQDLGARYVLVNIPDFRLFVVDGETAVFDSLVAVGRSYRRTPVFSDTIRYLVINPYWDVPHRLAVQDKLPEIQKDPEYLASLGIRVYRGWDADQGEIDPATVDWSQLSPRNFPYRLRQDPGPLNALGRVKLMFPNRFNVYLHDTPNREVFLTSDRDVSSGCIRVEKPLELAELLLGPSSNWNQAAMREAIEIGRETTVPLSRQIPVHILYWTAWAEDDGTVQFRRDIYGRDDLLAEALRQAAQSSRVPDGKP